MDKKERKKLTNRIYNAIQKVVAHEPISYKEAKKATTDALKILSKTW